eukprot:9289487-Alexandrium_andersonii.AAC.1
MPSSGRFTGSARAASCTAPPALRHPSPPPGTRSALQSGTEAYPELDQAPPFVPPPGPGSMQPHASAPQAQ